MTEPTVVRLRKHADFEPRWNSPRADEPGYRRGFVEGLSAVFSGLALGSSKN